MGMGKELKTEIIRARFNDTPHEIKTDAPLNLIFGHALQKSAYPRTEVIDPEVALDCFKLHVETKTEINPVARALFKIIYYDFDKPVTLKNLKQLNTNYRQTAGFLLKTILLLQARKKRFVWKYPESGLHPRHQLGIADVAILLSEPRKLVAWFKNLPKEDQQ